MKKKPILLRLLPWIIALLAIAALVIFVFIPIYSEVEKPISEPPVVHLYEGKDKSLIMFLMIAIPLYLLTYWFYGKQAQRMAEKMFGHSPQ